MHIYIYMYIHNYLGAAGSAFGGWRFGGAVRGCGLEGLEGLEGVEGGWRVWKSCEFGLLVFLGGLSEGEGQEGLRGGPWRVWGGYLEVKSGGEVLRAWRVWRVREV